MGLWSIDSNMSHHNGMELQDNSSLAECVPVVEPVFTFSNLHSEHNIPAPNGERVRSLAYCCNSYVC